MNYAEMSDEELLKPRSRGAVDYAEMSDEELLKPRASAARPVSTSVPEPTPSHESGSGYDTKLAPAEEAQYQAWRAKLPKALQYEGDYDLRGYWKDPETVKDGIEDGQHFTDKYKKPNHKTFSVESKYATGEDAKKAGRWDGDTFVPASESAEDGSIHVTFANGTSRDFESKLELSKFLRSKEYREGEEYQADREARDNKMRLRGIRPEMDSETTAAVKGFLSGAAEGAAKGALRAVKQGFKGLVVDTVTGIMRMGGTPVRMLGYDGFHKLADAIDGAYDNLGADALDYGFEDAWTKLGDAGAKITGIAGNLGGLALGGAGVAKVVGMVGKAGKAAVAANTLRAAGQAEKAAQLLAQGGRAAKGLAAVQRNFLPLMFGNNAAVHTYDTAIAKGKSKGEAAVLASLNGAIHFFGFKAFENQSLNKLLGMPKSLEAAMPKWATEAMPTEGGQTFSGVVDAVRKGMFKYILAERAKGALRAGGIMGLQNFLSDIPTQIAEGAKGVDIDRAWGKLVEGVREGALMEGLMGFAAACKTPKAAKEFVADKIFRNGYKVESPTSGESYDIPALLQNKDGRMFLMKQRPEATYRVLEKVERGETPSAKELDEAFLPPDMKPEELKKFAKDWDKDLAPYVDEAWNADRPNGSAPEYFANMEMREANEAEGQRRLLSKEDADAQRPSTEEVEPTPEAPAEAKAEGEKAPSRPEEAAPRETETAEAEKPISKELPKTEAQKATQKPVETAPAPEAGKETPKPAEAKETAPRVSEEKPDAKSGEVAAKAEPKAEDAQTTKLTEEELRAQSTIDVAETLRGLNAKKLLRAPDSPEKLAEMKARLSRPTKEGGVDPISKRGGELKAEIERMEKAGIGGEKPVEPASDDLAKGEPPAKSPEEALRSAPAESEATTPPKAAEAPQPAESTEKAAPTEKPRADEPSEKASGPEPKEPAPESKGKRPHRSKRLRRADGTDPLAEKEQSAGQKSETEPEAPKTEEPKAEADSGKTEESPASEEPTKSQGMTERVKRHRLTKIKSIIDSLTGRKPGDPFRIGAFRKGISIGLNPNGFTPRELKDLYENDTGWHKELGLSDADAEALRTAIRTAYEQATTLGNRSAGKYEAVDTALRYLEANPNDLQAFARARFELTHALTRAQQNGDAAGKKSLAGHLKMVNEQIGKLPIEEQRKVPGFDKANAATIDRRERKNEHSLTREDGSEIEVADNRQTADDKVETEIAGRNADTRADASATEGAAKELSREDSAVYDNALEGGESFKGGDASARTADTRSRSVSGKRGFTIEKVDGDNISIIQTNEDGKVVQRKNVTKAQLDALGKTSPEWAELAKDPRPGKSVRRSVASGNGESPAERDARYAADKNYQRWLKKRGANDSPAMRESYEGAKAESFGGVLKTVIRGIKRVVYHNKDYKGEADGEMRYLRDSGGRVVGTWNRKTGELNLYRGADWHTLNHEFGHVLRQFAEQEAARGNTVLRDKIEQSIDEVVNAGEKLPLRKILDDVKSNYPQEKGESDADYADRLRDEIWGAIRERRKSPVLEEAIKTLQGRAWYNRVWDAIKQAWKGILARMGFNRADLSGVDKMTPDEFNDFLDRTMAEGKTLGKVETGKDEGTRQHKGNYNEIPSAEERRRIDDPLDKGQKIWYNSPRMTAKGGADDRGATQNPQQPFVVGRRRETPAVNQTLARVADLAGGDDGAVEASRPLARIDKQRFTAAVSRAAREEGTWIDDVSNIADTKRMLGSGQESVVHPSRDGKSVVKLNKFTLIDSEHSPQDFFDSIKAYNEFAPDTKLDIIGFAENKDGDVCAVISQPHVRAQRHATQDEINKYMEERGFTVGRDRRSGRITHTSADYVITDAEPKNVLVGKDGEMYFIDLIVDKNKGAAGADRAAADNSPLQVEKRDGDKITIAWRNDEGKVERRATLTMDQLRKFGAASPEMKALVERIERGGIGFASPGPSDNSSLRYSRTPRPEGETPVRIDMAKKESAKEKYLRNFSDRYDPLKRLVEEAKERADNPGDVPDPYYEKRVQPGRNEADNHQIGILENKYTDFLKRHSRNQSEQEKLHEEVNMYLRARDALYRNPDMEKRLGVKDGSGMSTEDARRVIADFRRRMRLPILDEARKIMDEVKDTYGLQRLVDGGMLDQATADMLHERNPEYAPQRTSRMDEEGIDRNSTRSMEAAAIKKALGRSTLSDNPVEFLFLQARDAAARTNENRTRQEMAKLVRMFPELGKVRTVDKTSAYDFKTGKDAWIEDPHDVEAENPLVVSFRENGKRMRIEFADTPRGHLLADSMRGEGVVRGPEGFDRLTRRWAATATQLSATFTGRNFLKDTAEVALNSAADTGVSGAGKFLKNQFAELKPAVSAIRKYIKEGTFDGPIGRELKEFIDAGGSIGGIGREGYEELQDTFARKAKGLQRAFAGDHGAKEKTAAMLEAVFGKIENANKVVELLSRFNNYRSRRAKGESQKEAIIGAREDSTDFNMYGQQRWLNDVYMFSNSILGGTFRSTKQIVSGKYGRRAAASVLAYGMIEAAADILLNREDDKDAEKAGLRSGQNLSERERAQTLYFRVGGKYYRIPVHGGPWSSLKYTGGCIMRAMLGQLSWGDAAKYAGKEWATVASHFSGAGEIDLANGPKGAAISLTPSVLRPGIELAANQDFAGKHIYMPEGYDKTTPKSERGFESTGEGYKWFARLMNRVGGGNENRAAAWSWLDNPPEVYKHLVESVGKNMVRDVMLTVETAKRAAESISEGENKFTRDDVPFLRDVTRNVPDNSRRYYSAVEAYDRDKNEYKKTTDMKRKKDLGNEKPYLRPMVIDGKVMGKSRVDALISKAEDARHQELGKVKVKGKWVEPKNPLTDEQKEAARQKKLRYQAQVLEILEK